MKSCRRCENCILDLKALWIAKVYIHRCKKNGSVIQRPMMSGWKCKGYKKRQLDVKNVIWSAIDETRNY